jgi:hypothetical protein
MPITHFPAEKSEKRERKNEPYSSSPVNNNRKRKKERERERAQ